MESPQHIGDSTTNSISNQLSGTHLQKKNANLTPPSESASWSTKVYSSIYSGEKYMELLIELRNGDTLSTTLSILRRVQDSYVNVVQMLEVMIYLGYLNRGQAESFIDDKICNNPQYYKGGDSDDEYRYNDYRSHEVSQLRGIWVPYDKAVLIALENNIYNILKSLLLIDVHSFDKLPKKPDSNNGSLKRDSEEDMLKTLDGSPTKRRKTQIASSPKAIKAALESNTNYPYCLPPSTFMEKDVDIVLEVKLKFSEIFKNDGELSAELTTADIQKMFQSIVDKCSTRSQLPIAMLDVPLDSQGKTALHYAATLASNLVGIFIELGICSPIRGDNDGESPLVSAILVTNAMEKGNYVTMLDKWLWPNLWLFDKKKKSFLHHLIVLATKNLKASKYYLSKTVLWMVQNADKEKNLKNLCNVIVNAQESEAGNTALHLAGEFELKWFIYVLLELQADPQIANKVGLRPAEFDSVKEVMKIRENYRNHVDSVTATKALFETLGVEGEEDEYILELICTGVEFLNKIGGYPEVGSMEEEQDIPEKGVKHDELPKSLSHSERIFKSIQDLMSTTNEEYTKVINSKKKEINLLNKELRGATIITANNRFIAKKILQKVSEIDTMKLQLANIMEKLQVLKKKLPEGNDDEDIFNDDISNSELVKFDADEPFIIKAIYDKVANNEEIESTPELLDSLPSAAVLQARLNAYREVNFDLEKELESLLNYDTLTAKFKKVVSYCTGVDINEVDELLDGLLEAVEGQQ